MPIPKAVSTLTMERPRVRDEGAFRLLVLFDPTGAQIGTSFGLGTAEITIGRDEGVEGAVVLDDALVSRQHARLERSDDGRYVLRDLGSRNGSYVNGAPATERTLISGDVLRFGSHLLLFEFLSIQDCERLLERPDPESALRGPSTAIARVRAELATFGPLPHPVLLHGESGAGKELAALELHRLSRRSGPFVPVNCAAIVDGLAESELFGHASGAFTGARGAHAGLVRAAHGGTLFLDEIAELPLPLQAKLLRVLATGEVRAVGETKASHVDTRIVAATHVDLPAAVEAGEFRGDLYARLRGLVVAIPPLRQRKADIVAYLDELGRLPASRWSADAIEALLLHHWPYNVRELVQTAQALIARNPTGRIDLTHLAPDLRRPVEARIDVAPTLLTPLPPSLTPRQAPPTAEELRAALEFFGGNMVRIAAYFGKDRKQVYRWLERAGLDPDAFREK